MSPGFDDLSTNKVIIELEMAGYSEMEDSNMFIDCTIRPLVE